MSPDSHSAPDRWSLDSWFSGLRKPDYDAFKTALEDEIRNLQEQAGTWTGGAAAMAAMLTAVEALEERLGHLAAYLGCLSADDATDETVQAEEASAAKLEAEATKLQAVLRAALASMNEPAFESLLAETGLEGAGHAVRRLREEGGRQMPPEMESLAADLNVDGLQAWGRLYDTLTGRMEFEMRFPDGRVETVPMARRRALMSESERRLREAAFHAGQKPWQDHAVTLAAGLNGIAGTRLSLYRRRGRPDFLEAPLFDGAMSRASLEAMLAAIEAHLDLPRRAVRAAARRQGTPALHFFDLEAPQFPAPGDTGMTWGGACAVVEQAFAAAYPALGAYFREILDRRWIEAQPRTGKRPGAFCTGSRLRREERIYMTFHGTMHDTVTLAHEAGHAWHSCVLRPARSLAAAYPMTLAETASNFAEMILLDSLKRDPGLTPEFKAHLLDQELLRAHAYLLNIPMRYEFEKAFYTERAAGEVSASRLGALMDEAQRRLYGDTLLPDGTDPFFWASKMHFFITGVSFYNFPYVFGYLLSQALYARFQAEGASFLPRYEAFLAASGSATCEEVARRSLGEDLTSPDFWAGAVRAMEPALLAYEDLVSGS